MALRSLSIGWCILMCTLAPATAHQVQLGVEQGLDVDSNSFASSLDPITDGLYRLTPVFTLEQPDSEFTYFVKYRPIYSAYFRTDGVNGVDHSLRASASHQLDPRDVLRFQANFLRVRGIRSTTLTGATGETEVVPTILGTTQRFDANLSIDHNFSARSVGSLALRYDRSDYDDSLNVPNQAYGARTQITRALSQRLVAGLNLDARYRAFEEVGGSPASYTTVLNANLIADLQITNNLSLKLSGGPAGVLARQSEPAPRLVSRWSPVFFDRLACPVGPCGRVWGPDPTMTSSCGTSFGDPILDLCRLTSGPVTNVAGFPGEIVAVPVDPDQKVFGLSTESLTYFVNASLTRRFRTGYLEASFARNEDAAAGIGTSTIATSGQFAFAWRASDLWTVRVSGSYMVRESVSQFPFTQVSAKASTVPLASGDLLAEANELVAVFARQTFRQEIGILDVGLLRNLTEHSRLRFRFRYYNQSRDISTSDRTRGFEKFVGGVSYVYEFDAYKL